MKVKGSVKVDIWFDPKVRLYSAAYKDTYGNKILGDIEVGFDKTSVLKTLAQNAPEFEFEKKKDQNRE